MNEHQRSAIKIAKMQLSEDIGGYENDMMDYSPDEEEYIRAKLFLSKPHDELVEQCYTRMLAFAKGCDEHIRFAGKDFICNFISKYLTESGY